MHLLQGDVKCFIGRIHAYGIQAAAGLSKAAEPILLSAHRGKKILYCS